MIGLDDPDSLDPVRTEGGVGYGRHFTAKLDIPAKPRKPRKFASVDVSLCATQEARSIKGGLLGEREPFFACLRPNWHVCVGMCVDVVNACVLVCIRLKFYMRCTRRRRKRHFSSEPKKPLGNEVELNRCSQIAKSPFLQASAQMKSLENYVSV